MHGRGPRRSVRSSISVRLPATPPVGGMGRYRRGGALTPEGAVRARKQDRAGGGGVPWQTREVGAAGGCRHELRGGGAPAASELGRRARAPPRRQRTLRRGVRAATGVADGDPRIGEPPPPHPPPTHRSEPRRSWSGSAWATGSDPGCAVRRRRWRGSGKTSSPNPSGPPAGHAIYVVSSNRHAVNPWLAGRFGSPPPVKDLTAAGFPWSPAASTRSARTRRR